MRRVLLLAALLLVAAALPARAQPLIADLSRHLVAITTGFAGTDLLLFGAVEAPGDVVVVVRGPRQDEVVRRKARRLIWMNSGQAVLRNVPVFYHVAASRPLDQIATPAVLERHQIGAAHLDLNVDSADGGAAERDYRDALIRLKRDRGLYTTKVAPVTFIGGRLFRTEVHFPATVPVGTYMVEVYLIADGEVVSAQTTPLAVSKLGVGADIYDFAHQRSALYGIMAILIAVASGWLAAAAFRKS